MIDPLGVAIVEVRDDPAVRAIVGQHAGVWKVRAPEAGEGWEPPYVVLFKMGHVRRAQLGTERAGLMTQRVGANCFGANAQQASQLYRAVSDVLHNRRIRVGPANRLIYITREEVGGQPDTQPGTNWPYETGIFTVIASAQAVA